MQTKFRILMAKTVAVFLTLVLASQFVTVLAYGQPDAPSTVWETMNVDEIMKFMAKHWNNDTKTWMLDVQFNSADEVIGSQLFDFIGEIQDIRSLPPGESSFSKSLETAQVVSSLFSGQIGSAAALLGLSQVPFEYRQDIAAYLALFADYLAQFADAMTVLKDYEIAKIQIEGITLHTKDFGAVGFLADSVGNVIGLFDLVNDHSWRVEHIEQLQIEGTDLVRDLETMIVQYELHSEQGQFTYDVIDFAIDYILMLIGGEVGKWAGGIIGALASPFIDGLGPVAGAVLGNYIGSKAGSQIAKLISTAVHNIMLETGFISEDIYWKFCRFYRYYNVKAQIVDIWTWTPSFQGDNRMLKTVPIDILYVKVKNIGKFKETFVVAPKTDGKWTVLWSDYIWNTIEDIGKILNGEMELVGQEVTLEPNEEKILSFALIPYGWPLSESFPYFPTYYPESEVGFSLWYWQPQRDNAPRLLHQYSEEFYSQDLDLGAAFEVIPRPQKPYYKPGEQATIAINIQNTGTTTVYDVAAYVYISYFEEPQAFLTTTTIGQLDGESSDEIWLTYSHAWTIPSATKAGPIQVTVTIQGADTSGGTSKIYDKTHIQKQEFDVYQLRILTPRSSNPAVAGDPDNPTSIHVSLTGLPSIDRLKDLPHFSVKIGESADTEISDPNFLPVGIYALKVAPPTQESEGDYNLEVTAIFDGETDTAAELESVRYTKSLSAEPVDEGLSWLRTRESGAWWGDVGARSLALLAFLNAGFDETDPYVSNGIQFLLSNTHGGAIYNDYSHATYQTSLAILALVATYNSNYASTIEAARDWLVSSQWDESNIWYSVSRDDPYYGGFGYGDSSRPDLSNTQFALLALDAAGLAEDDSTWTKTQVFLHRCQKVNFALNLNIEGTPYTVQPSSYVEYDGGFVYVPGYNPYYGYDGPSMGSMTGAGLWGLLLSGVPKSNDRTTAAMNWVINHYTWDDNYGCVGYRLYYYYLSMAKALTMYREEVIGGHNWYQDLYEKLDTAQISAAPGEGYWSRSGLEDFDPELTTAYAILSLQTRTTATSVQRLSFLTFILRSHCLIKITDPEGNIVGYNYNSGNGENEIATAVYSGPYAEPQYIIIVNPKPGNYKLELVGISAGQYHLTIQGCYGEDITKSIDFVGDVNPGELHGSDVTVTAIVGPIDVYADPPHFEETLDNTPPTTTLAVGAPSYVDSLNSLYVSKTTPFTLISADNAGGIGVASSLYRVCNSTYATDWLMYSGAFQLTDFSDGLYSIDYYSVDAIGNIEPTNTASAFLDTRAPTTKLVIGSPKYVSSGTYVTKDTPFTLTATDRAGVKSTAYRIYNSSYSSGWLTYSTPFKLTSVCDGYYTIAYNSTDNVDNVEVTKQIKVTLFSWNYVFKDTYGRNTVLKINTRYKFFQLIAPSKDFGIRKATYMQLYSCTITIKHCDTTLKLVTTTVNTKTDYCVTTAWDLKTRRQYLLVDKPGFE